MQRSEIVAGLKKGRTLILDGWASKEERKLILDLKAKGLVEVQPIHSDKESQYTAYSVKWIKDRK